MFHINIFVFITLFLLSTAIIYFLLNYSKFFKSFFYQILYDRFYFIKDYNIEYWFLITVNLIFFISYYIFNKLFFSLIFISLFFILFYVFLNYLQEQVIKKIENDIPLFLKLLAASLSSGYSIQAALKENIYHWQGPLQKEMGLLLHELQVGHSLNEALANLRQRLPSEGIKIMALTLEVALHSGGSVAGLLDQLADNLNKKIDLEQKIDALSFQGKIQAYVLTLIPYVLLFILYWLYPNWIAPFFESMLGNLVLLFCITMSFIGFYFINKIINIKI